MVLTLVVGAIGSASAAAEPSGELPVYGGVLEFPAIESAAAPEEYSWRVELAPGETLTAVTPYEVRIGSRPEAIHPPLAKDAAEATVPTTLSVSGADVVTLTVHHHEGTFAYPIHRSPFLVIAEHVIVAELPRGSVERAEQAVREASPPAVIPPIEPNVQPPLPCKVPALHGLSLKTAKAHLRAAQCTIGQVHLGAGATAGKGKVVKQFRAAGTQLAAGAPVAVKLG
jgi:hypothetical protein